MGRYGYRKTLGRTLCQRALLCGGIRQRRHHVRLYFGLLVICTRCSWGAVIVESVASELLKWAENYAKEHRAYEMSCDVSITAKTFFSKNGYRTEKEQSVRVKDIFMTNYAMKKKL